ncbi:cation-translocating P-type ATPase [Pontivivens ytuae]|uniref:HAD-IC family P-type ATPase n=1 Tax=Pontivivens ytuae TaxID=2789856 RepID=A0A7S9QB90_9RHOB|nr:HAD-IC family P-type ATPase [Pontivivens ytuae]QPH52938.1 HAD-IC family P-type ATPase [Pontivivens ytuae]
MPSAAETFVPMPQGLTGEEVAARRAEAGWNELPRPPRDGPLRVLLRQFTGLLVLILIAAAGIALALGETVDAIAIGLVVALNGILGFVQEWRAENALEALRSMLSPSVLVIRDGEERVIPARELVPGDLVVLAAGDRVPADVELVASTELRADESVLTGESLPVHKTAGAAEDAGRLLAGTAVAAGRGQGVVIAIGTETAFGRIAELTGSLGRKRTHLQVQLAKLAQQLGLAALLIAAAIIALGAAVGRPLFEMFMTGLSLAVAMVPEGLPAVVTITLALGASAMARRKALARRLQAAETLGAASVICTDKTGTLTENKMTATRIWTPAATYKVTGTGYDPAGHIARDGQVVRAEGDPALAALLDTALTCTHAHLRRADGAWEMIGAPTEGALVTLAYKGWAPLPDPDAQVAETPFSSERKRMSVLSRSADGHVLHVKGAPEVVLEHCIDLRSGADAQPLTEATRAEVLDAYQAMAAEGLRVIALAARAAAPGDMDESGLTLLGLIGLIDPPRPEVRQAIAGARAAGIRVIVITGDSAVTAAAIAAELGMEQPRCVEGAELEAISDAALEEMLEGDVLFARTLPEHKMRIVAALQARGQIVAMTGDGVNDAPALKRADIGIAMGIRGTDVSKDASDLVLLDDNFATIVAAIAEGRRQFDNVAKFVRYLLASNAGEVIAIVVNLIVGGPLIFLATQILWMNLVTDGVTAVALGLEKGERGQMERPPRKRDAPILGLGGLGLIVAFGCYTAGASLWLFYTMLPLGEDIARTVAFTGMVVFEKVSVFAFRSLREPCWRIGWFSNPFLLLALGVTLALQVLAITWPPLQLLLHTTTPRLEHLGLVALLALPLIIVPELIKSLRPRHRAAEA